MRITSGIRQGEKIGRVREGDVVVDRLAERDYVVDIEIDEVELRRIAIKAINSVGKRSQRGPVTARVRRAR